MVFSLERVKKQRLNINRIFIIVLKSRVMFISVEGRVLKGVFVSDGVRVREGTTRRFTVLSVVLKISLLVQLVKGKSLFRIVV